MFTCRVIPELKLIHTVVTGDLTKDAALDVFKGIYAAPNFNPTYDSLTDLRSSTGHLISLEDAKEIVMQSPDIDKRIGKRAVVVADDEGRIIFGRFYQEFSRMITGQDLRIFTSAEEAIEWLGLPPDALT